MFTHSRSRRILLQFAAEPRSVGEVARALAIDLKQLHHAVTRLCRLGLLQVVDERKRAGRQIKLYRCAADSFFIPAAVAPAPFSLGLARELQEAIVRDAATSVKGMTFSLDTEGRVAGKVIEMPGAGTPPLDSWRILRLNATQARRLKQEMRKVLDRFQAEPASGGQVYLVHAGMARRLDHWGATDNLNDDGGAPVG